jgi:hypothetical protein
MRTIKNLDVAQNSNAKFPFSTIQNETDTQDGTPVVEEIYGDIITNTYKLLQEVGITPTETQDSDTSQYQILQALKQLPNSLNDIERVLSLSGTTWSVDLDLSYLPNKYFFVARASDNYVSGISYNFSGSNESSIPFVSGGFKASDELLVIIDNDEVRAYSLSAFYGVKEEVFSVLGQPLSYNDSDKMYYFEDGKLFSDTPSINDIQTTIQNFYEDSEIVICDVAILNGYVLCLCLKPSTINYFFVQFALNDLETVQEVDVVETSFGDSVDYVPYMYVDGFEKYVYISNTMNTLSDDFKLTRLSYFPLANELSSPTEIDLRTFFEKTTNSVINGNYIYTLISGNLKKYGLSDESVEDLGRFPNALGRLINFNGNIYLLNGEVAKKWF